MHGWYKLHTDEKEEVGRKKVREGIARTLMPAAHLQLLHVTAAALVEHGRSHHRGNGGSCLLTSERLIFPIKAHRAWSHPPMQAVSCSKVQTSSSYNKSSKP